VFVLRTLGGLRLTGPAGELLPGRQKDLALLTYIAGHRSGSLARAELAALLWGERPEATARHSLRQVLLRLKRALAGSLDVHADSVSLADGAVELDVAAFEADLAAGREREAVARWQGEFLSRADDIGGENYRDWVEGERERLRRRLVSACERLVVQAQRAGDWPDAVRFAERWIEAAPLDERAHHRLVETLSLAGCHDEAAARHAGFIAKVKREDAGEPSPAFLQLERELRKRIRADRRARPSPGSTALFTPDLVGRTGAFNQLTTAWHAAKSGEARIVVVEGDEGIGKTRLCEEFLRAATEDSGQAWVLRARAREADQGVPWSTARELLGGLTEAPGLATAPPGALAALGQLVPAMRERFPGRADAASWRVDEAIEQALAAVAVEVPIVAFIDDAPSVDAATLGWIVGLATRVRQARVLVLMSARTDQSTAVASLAQLRSAHGVERVRLHALQAPEIERLLASMLELLPTERHDLATRIHAESGGNPFYVIELTAALLDEGRLTLESGGAWRLSPTLEGRPLPMPASVQEALSRRLAQLSAPARRLVEAAAVLGAPAEPTVLQEVAALAPADLDPALDEVVARRFLRMTLQTPGRYEFSHELARHATYNLLPVARRRALHRAAVQALNERGGRDALTRAAVRYHRVRAESVALQAGRWAKRHAAYLTFGTVGALLAAVVFIRYARQPLALDPDLVAVAPFDVLDPKFALWHEGLVDYLSRNLDGAGSMRTVSPTVVLRGWKGPADPASATELGRRSGAKVVVFGQIVGEGSDSVRLRPTLIDVATGRALAEPERTDLGDRIDRLADSLTRDVLRDLGRLGPAVHLGSASVGTKSLPALKEFLRGEQLLRRFSLDSAITAYGVAVQRDSSFALALRRLGLARGWRGEAGGPLALKAGRFNHGLAPRDSLLIAADSLEAASDDSLDLQYWSHRVRKFATLEEASRRYPDDPEVWYALGEARFHLGYVVGSTAQQTIDAFNRAIVLDTAFAPAYFHPVQLALDRNDPAAAKRYVNGYLGLTSGVPEGAGLRLVERLLNQERSANVQALLDTASANVLFDAWRSVQRWPDSAEVGVRLLRLLAGGRRGIGVSADTAWTGYLLATALLYRGHLREARAMVPARLSVPFEELAVVGAVPADSVATALDRWLRTPNERQVAADPPWVNHCYRSFLAAEWWAERQDTLRLLALMHRGESVARSVRNAVLFAAARGDAILARAALALARRDTAEALRRLLAFPDSLCASPYGSLSLGLGPLRMIQFHLLAATHHDRDAARLFDQQVSLPLGASAITGTLERGQVAEHLGDRVTATRAYEFVVAAWRNADPRLHRYVTEAQAALQRLGHRPP